MSSELNILFEDNHLIAVNKPAGTLVQGDKTGDVPISEIVKNYLKVAYHKPGEAYIGLPHRLDRPVSGVLLLSKTSKALARLNKMFQTRNVRKTYWAVVKNKPDPTAGNLRHYLIKHEATNKSKAYSSSLKNAKEAVLDYQLLSSSDKYHLLKVEPKTGRHHQIRVQLSKIGCSIKGDLKYGGARPNKDGSIHLHARRLEIIHPVRKTELVIEAPPPDEALWNFFLRSQTRT